VFVSLVVIGKLVVPALAGQPIFCHGYSAPVPDPIVHNAGPNIVWKQQRKVLQGLRSQVPYHLLSSSPKPLAFLLE
jgi:hypothetical protein